MQPAVMGVLNVTPDSFSDGGRFTDSRAAMAWGEQLFADGAAIVDVGGESTRPGADPVSAEVELARVTDVVAALAGKGRVSIDTTKPEVASAAVAVGAEIINDVSASLADVAADLGVTWIAMHCQGTPATMQADPSYDDVVAEVREYLADAVRRGRSAGVSEVWIDPGIGFGKTTEHNLELLANLDQLVALGVPVVVGTSRKRFIGELHARSDNAAGGSAVPAAGDATPPEDRLEGSLATATWAFSQGASVVRSHDVAATVQVLQVVAA